MRRIRYRIEYIALRVAAGLCLALPHSAALALAWVTAGIGFHVVRFRRAEAVRRTKPTGQTQHGKEPEQLAG